jgi:acyl-CoA dehydrogenase
MHSAAGISQDFNLADFWMYARICRFADGPNAVHRGVTSKIELRRQAEKRGVLRND